MALRRDQGTLASDPDYSRLIRDVEAPTPARYNNDPRLLYEAAGSAGKLCVFAVRLDTFPKSGPSKVFYIGSNDYLELTTLKQVVKWLVEERRLPPSARIALQLAKADGTDTYCWKAEEVAAIKGALTDVLTDVLKGASR